MAGKSQHRRIDLIQRVTSSDEKTGGFGLSIEPDPRRCETCVINVEEYRKLGRIAQL